jgi:hypothetical protein
LVESLIVKKECSVHRGRKRARVRWVRGFPRGENASVRDAEGAWWVTSGTDGISRGTTTGVSAEVWVIERIMFVQG